MLAALFKYQRSYGREISDAHTKIGQIRLGRAAGYIEEVQHLGWPANACVRFRETRTHTQVRV